MGQVGDPRGRERWIFQDVCFFFQAEDGIRDDMVTGVQTCALPIFADPPADPKRSGNAAPGLYPTGKYYCQSAGERPGAALPDRFGSAGGSATVEARHGFGTGSAVYIRPSFAPKAAALLASFCMGRSSRCSTALVRLVCWQLTRPRI